MGRLVRGGEVVTTDAVRRLDVRVQDGRILEVGASLEPGTDDVLDAGGLHILPGAIDPHGHQWEPGFTSPPDFRDATASAAVGGVTTLLDHPLTPPVVIDGASFEAKVAVGERTSLIDFGLHGGATPSNLDEFAGMWAAGATGIKLFTCPTGTALDGFGDPVLLERAMVAAAAVGALLLVHAEDAGILASNERAIRERGGGTIADFGTWHDLEAELVAVDRVLAIAARVGTAIYVVHASHPAVVARVNDVDGVDRVGGLRPRARVETCPHYLHLIDKDLRRLGGSAVTAPPVRDAEARAGLRRCLAEGWVDTVGSDHCAIAAAGKTGPGMADVIPGVPGLDVFLPLLLDLVADGVLELPRLAAVIGAYPAQIFGLPTKGAIEVGRDADLVLVDLAAARTVEASAVPCSAGWSPYEGRRLRGTVVETWSRGVTVARDGQPVGDPGHGQFLPRNGGR